MAVYFVQAGEGGPIKIGFTAGDVRRRIAELRTGCPYPLIPLGTIDGNESRERELHRQFRSERIGREWFAPCLELMALIANANPVSDIDKEQTLASKAIDTLGGNTEVAALFGVRENTVSMWRTRGFPWRAWLFFEKAARAAGIDWDSLQPPRPRSIRSRNAR